MAVSAQDDTAGAADDITVTIPDVRGLGYKDAGDLLHEFGLRLQSSGSQGIVYHQSPPPGNLVERGSTVEVQLRTQPQSATTPVPDVRGMTLRRALNILNAARVKTRISGSGVVVKQRQEKKGNEVVCVLECRTTSR